MLLMKPSGLRLPRDRWSPRQAERWRQSGGWSANYILFSSTHRCVFQTASAGGEYLVSAPAWTASLISTLHRFPG
jgi:hypothetical protein